MSPFCWNAIMRLLCSAHPGHILSSSALFSVTNNVICLKTLTFKSYQLICDGLFGFPIFTSFHYMAFTRLVYLFSSVDLCSSTNGHEKSATLDADLNLSHAL
uniref:Uncharacterized protein n=1 Tax=Nelumbo nucifera TaxID=4432 RepID=A0A822YW04_NELNU|nr:TPA_asm: hypothetical protein HUJ06_005945 [Nelumbo nucifera]